MSASDAIQAPFVVEDIVKRGWTRVAIFADTTGYGEAGLKDVVAALAAKSLKPVHIARFALGVKDLREDLAAARDAGADVVFSYTVGVESAVIANGRKELKWKVPQVGAWTLSFPFFINGARDAAEGAMMAQTFIAEPSNEHRATFLRAYKKKFQKAMAVPMAAAQAYDSTYLLTASLFGIRDGNLSGPNVKTALENIAHAHYGVVATYDHPFSLNDKDAISQNMLIMGKVSGGAVTFARPEDATRNVIVKRKI
jgi:branched-chain amino acid transport system substrate-binding protein